MLTPNIIKEIVNNDTKSIITPRHIREHDISFNHKHYITPTDNDVQPTVNNDVQPIVNNVQPIVKHKRYIILTDDDVQPIVNNDDYIKPTQDVINEFDRLFPDDVYVKDDSAWSKRLYNVIRLIHSDKISRNELMTIRKELEVSDGYIIDNPLLTMVNNVLNNTSLPVDIPPYELGCGDEYINIFSENPCMIHVRVERILTMLYNYMDIREELLEQLIKDRSRVNDITNIDLAIRYIIYSYVYDTDDTDGTDAMDDIIHDDYVNEYFKLIDKLTAKQLIDRINESCKPCKPCELCENDGDSVPDDHELNAAMLYCSCNIDDKPDKLVVPKYDKPAVVFIPKCDNW